MKLLSSSITPLLSVLGSASFTPSEATNTLSNSAEGLNNSTATTDDVTKDLVGIVPSTINGTYVIGPDYTPDPATEPCLTCKQHGITFDLQMPFENSSYYNCNPDDNPYLAGNCTNGLCGQMNVTQAYRQIKVYIPPSYKDGEETGVMAVLDGGDGDFDIAFPSGSNVLENLIDSNVEERSLPSFIVIGIAS